MEITLIGVTEKDGGVRKIPMNYRSVTGRVEPIDRPTIAHESTLERDLAVLLDFDSTVDVVVSQPMRIDFLDASGRKRSYTPDFLAKYRRLITGKTPSPILYEVKFKDELRERADELAPGFCAARLLCEQRGWHFSIMDETRIRTPYLNNVQRLRHFRLYPDDGKSATMLMRTLRELKTSTPSELLAATFMDRTNRAQAVGAMWRLVCEQAIGVNLMSDLTMQSEIWPSEFSIYG